MAGEKRLVAVAKELNVGTHSIVEHLKNKGFEVDDRPTAKLTEEMYHLLLKAFQQDAVIKQKAEEINIGQVRKEREEEKAVEQVVETRKVKVEGPKVVGKVDLVKKEAPKPPPPPAEEKRSRRKLRSP